MAAGKLVVASGRTIYGKDKEKFGPGAAVTAEALGIEKKDFEILKKEGSVVVPGKTPDPVDEPADEPDAGEDDDK